MNVPASLASLALLAAITLTGCGATTDTSEAASTPTTSASAQPLPEADPTPTDEPSTEGTEPDDDPMDSLSQDQIDSLFLTVVHDSAPGLADLSDARLIEIAHTTCEAYDTGLTFFDIVMAATDGTDVNASDVGTVIGAGVQAYCPEHADQMQSEIESLQ